MGSQDIQWLLAEKYDGEKTEGFFADCQRLEAGEPLAYVIGWIPFLDTKIYLDSKPLIPRVETEFWVNEALMRIKSRSVKLTHQPKVLDLCAGSGCVGVAVAKELLEAEVHFAELMPEHIPTIERNCAENDIESNRCKVIESDLFSNITDTYDFILTNPPYIDPSADRAEAGVKKYEPHEALYGGKDGLELIFTIIHEGKKYLRPGGQIWIEHEPEQVELIRALANTREFLCQVGYDQYKVARFSVLTME